MLRIFVLVVFALGFVVSARASVVHVADGDCAALADAIASASTQTETTIVLAHGGSYLSYGGAYTDCSLLVHQGNVTVEASGSEIQPFCLARLIVVDAGARLTLRNASLVSPECGFTPPLSAEISNGGELQLEAVNIADFSVKNDAGATMTLRNATARAGGIDNAGGLEIYNSTLLAEPIYNTGVQLVLANSVVPILSGPAVPPSCAVRGLDPQSLGGNVVGSYCGWAVSADRRSADAEAGLGASQDNGGLGVPTFAPTSSSIVRGIGVAQYCEPTDARGLVRPQGACDAGAVQFDETKFVGEGGMNGLWYDRAANGHYVTIQRVHDDDTALVIWNTFDRSGNQAWIYGVGHVSGKHIHVEMSQNLGGRLQAGGAPTGSRVSSWGTVDVDLTSCLAGTLRYQSPNPAYGSGRFPIDRLAYVSAFGCVD